jgi:hypothetical protein
MRTIIAFSGVTLAVLVALLGRGLVDDDTPTTTKASPTTSPPRKASITPRQLPSTPESPAEGRDEPNAVLYAAINELTDARQKSVVVAELAKSGTTAEQRFLDQGNALGASLVAAGLASDYRCFAAGCYFTAAKQFVQTDERTVVRERDKHAPRAVLAITGGLPPDKLVVLVNHKEGS